MRCNRFKGRGASVDRHGPGSSRSGGSAAAGQAARSTGAPRPAASCPT